MIEVKNLSFNYPKSETPAIESLNFTVPKGKIFGFLGPNGAGKTTTQKILNGLFKDYDGEVKILDINLKEWDESYYEHIGVSFEFPNLYSKLTAKENLEFFASFYTKQTADPMSLLKMVGLEKDSDKLVGQFSKGMKMKLNFARALIHDPEILFLDEPTSGLDPANQNLIKQLIKKQKDAGKTIFLTTHNMNDAEELCDEVAFIVKGKIVLIDKPSELKLRTKEKMVEIKVRDNGSLKSYEYPLEGLGNNSEFIHILKTQKVESIHTREATLSKIFLEVTGANLSDENGK